MTAAVSIMIFHTTHTPPCFRLLHVVPTHKQRRTDNFEVSCNKPALHKSSVSTKTGTGAGTQASIIVWSQNHHRISYQEVRVVSSSFTLLVGIFEVIFCFAYDSPLILGVLMGKLDQESGGPVLIDYVRTFCGSESNMLYPPK
jgi:hypothetical protein